MKKNILFVMSHFCGGGIEKVFMQIANTLIDEQNDDYKIHLFVINGIQQSEDEIPKEVHIIRNKYELYKYKKTIIMQKWHIVNFSSDWKSSLISNLISGRKYISWIHTNPDSMWKAKTKYINFNFLKRSYKIVTVCKEQEKILKNKYKFNNDITTIYNSVDIKKAEILANEKLTFDKPFILMTARIDFDTKDFYTVLEAYNGLPSDIKDKYQLVFLGDGPNRNELIERINMLDMSEHVSLPGYDSNPYKWYSNASVGILSSKSEGFSLSVIEALSLKCTMIITKFHTGSDELSENGKFCRLVNIGDVEEMRTAIIEVLSGDFNPAEDELTEFYSKFDVSNFNNQIIKFFDEISEE